MYVANQAALLAQLTQIIGTGGDLNGAKAALFTNDIYPTRANVVGDFTFADFGGLTNQHAITWGTPFLNGNSQAEVQGGLLHWLTTAGTGLPVTAYGIIILLTDASDWVIAERFAVPFNFTASGQNLSVVPRVVLDT